MVTPRDVIAQFFIDSVGPTTPSRFAEGAIASLAAAGYQIVPASQWGDLVASDICHEQCHAKDKEGP